MQTAPPPAPISFDRAPELSGVLGAVPIEDRETTQQLLSAVYDELRHLAAHRIANEAAGHTLEPTALVHEAWLRLVGSKRSAPFENRAHFFAAAAEAMRRILVESAQRKQCQKRGGALERVDLDEVNLPLPMPHDELIALDDALKRLAALDARAAQMVNLCFFTGLTQEEAAIELGISVSTAERIWAFARTWLFREIKKTRGS